MEGTITAILPQQRRAGKRFNVFLEGRYAFSVQAEVAGTLAVGQSLSGADVAQLLESEELGRAVDAGLTFLAYRPRSEQEVRRRLERDYPSVVVEAALDRLRDLKLIDDAAFAQFWVEQRQSFRPRGARAVRQELRLKGIDPDLASQAAEAGADEAEQAYRAGLKKARALAGLDFPTFRQRLATFLARRGFGWETINAVVRRLWEEASRESRVES